MKFDKRMHVVFWKFSGPWYVESIFEDEDDAKARIDDLNHAWPEQEHKIENRLVTVQEE